MSGAKCTGKLSGRGWCIALRLCTLLCLVCPGIARGEIRVATDFEGGSARVLAIDQAARAVRICPAGEPARGWPCWWYLTSMAAAGDKLTLEVVGSATPLVQASV
jgi:hypothetical protein